MSAPIPNLGPTRRASLLLPFLLPGLLPGLLAACGGNTDDRTEFPPLRYDYLPPIPLKVAALDFELRFVPGRVPGDVSASSPIDLIATLKELATDRLKPVGSANRAVFSITEASLILRGDQLTGTIEATLEIRADDGQRSGYAQARVRRGHTGKISNLRGTLYDMVTDMLIGNGGGNDRYSMNVELEFQIKKHLKDWISDTVNAAPTPVAADPLPPPSRR